MMMGPVTTGDVYKRQVVRPHQQGGLVQARVRTGIAGIAAAGKDIIIGINGVVMVKKK